MTDVIRKDVKDRLKNGDYNCSKKLTLSMFSGKWKLVILFHLGTDGAYRFNELMRLLPKVTHKVLTNQLREMAEDGLITRHVSSGSQTKVTYEITELGQSLMPIANQMYEWGENRIKALKVTPQFSVNEEVEREAAK